MRHSDRPWLRLAVRAHRLLLGFAPRRDRERFGAETEDAFRALIHDAWGRRGIAAAGWVAFVAFVDVVGAGVKERAASVRIAGLSGWLTDLRQSARIFRREPVLAAAVTLTLAVVTGPALAIGSVLYHLMLAPLPYPNADRLVVIQHRTPQGLAIYLPPAAVTDYRAVEAFEHVGGAMTNYGLAPILGGHPTRIEAARVTAGLLSGLGAGFVVGRDIQLRVNEAVVTRSFALAQFGAEDAAIGQSLALRGGTSYTIVGVLGRAAPMPGPPGRLIFIPHVSADGEKPAITGGSNIVMARLKPGVSIEVAQAQVRAVAAGLRATRGGPDAEPVLVPMQQAIAGSFQVVFLVFGVAVGAVFVISVASLAGLVLARAASRVADVAVRASLGASRWRLLRGWYSDGLMLALPGLVLGAGLAVLSLEYARGSLFARLTPLPEDGALATIGIAALALGLCTTALFAIAPPVAGLLRAPALSLASASRHVVGLRRVRSQSVLIALQVALSLALVTSAAWLSASLWRMLSQPTGIDMRDLVVVNVESLLPRAVQIENARTAIARFGQLVGDPAGIAVASSLPGMGRPSFGPNQIRPGDPPFKDGNAPILARYSISTGYFRVAGIPLLAGRPFVAADEAYPERVLIVSRSFESAWFPDGALGRVVSFGRDDRREIIGVVADVHAANLGEESRPQIYVPMTDMLMGNPSKFVLRTTRPLEAIRSDVTAAVAQLDLRASLSVMSAEDAIGTPLVFRRFTLQLLGALGLIALALVVVNVYALSMFAVLQRAREIGIRVALGAPASQTVALVMRRGLVWTGVGLVAGAVLTAFVAAPFVQAQLFQTRPWDPGPLVAAVAVVTLVAAFAAWIPARRAACIDPAITLRAE
jgi:putative ABC transport system permease protein